MLLKEFGEGGYRDIEGIIAIVLMDSGQLGRGGYTSGFLEVFQKRFGIGIDSVSQRLEGALFGIIEESALLEEERDVFLAPSLVFISTALHF